MPRRWALSGWVRVKGPGRTPRGKVRGRDGKGDPQGDLFPFSSGFTFSPVQGSDRRLQDFPFLSSGSLKRSLFSSFLSRSVCNHTSSPSCLRRYFCLFHPSPDTEAFSLFRASFPPLPFQQHRDSRQFTADDCAGASSACVHHPDQRCARRSPQTSCQSPNSPDFQISCHRPEGPSEQRPDHAKRGKDFPTKRFPDFAGFFHYDDSG